MKPLLRTVPLHYSLSLRSIGGLIRNTLPREFWGCSSVDLWRWCQTCFLLQWRGLILDRMSHVWHCTVVWMLPVRTDLGG